MLRSGSAPRARGFTYVALLFALAVFAVAGVSFLQYWSENVRRERERELLSIGREFVEAIASYYESTPGPQKRFPASVEHLVQDPRFVGTRRHLRRVYIDPMTLSAEWGIVKSTDGGVMGVFSLSDAAPRKQAGWPAWVQAVQGAGRYSDWKFVYVPSSRN